MKFLFSLIAAALAGMSLHNPHGPNVRALRRRSLFSSRSPSKYTPHDGKRQQERHRLQRQTATVLVPTKNGGYKARTMNAWLAQRFPLVATEGGAQ